MRLLWNDEWIETPAPSAVPGAVAISVQATVPLASVPMPTGRIIRSPRLKTARFALLDGPDRTLRKARSKRTEIRLQSDYRIVAVLGHPAEPAEGRPVLGLALRVPACAEILLCREELVVESSAAGEATLGSFAGHLRDNLDEVLAAASQSYLYSGEAPPARLQELVRTAASAPEGRPPGDLLRPPETDRTSATALQLGSTRANGKPVALLGAGDYARTQIIPAMRSAGFVPFALADREPQVAAEVGRSSGFSLVTSSDREAIDSMPESGLVLVATSHDTHAELAAVALEAGHRVFVEKPALVTPHDLSRLEGAIAAAPGQLDVGFNRRHHPLTRKLRTAVAAESGPLTIVCVVREISLEPNHWYHWPNQGTRVTGNLCHWIDLGVALLDDDRRHVDVAVGPAPVGGSVDSERALTVTFDDGSVLIIVATDRGDDIRGVQETIEVRRGLMTARIDDFRTLRVLRNGRARRSRQILRGKGHEQMFRDVFARAKSGAAPAYPEADIERVGVIQLEAARLMADA
jgi:predicted dehydrogenase